MEHYKVSKLLNDSTVSKFLTKKWVEVSDLSSSQHSVNKNIRFQTSMLRSNLCDQSDAYIVAVKGIMSVTGTKSNNRRNNAPFRSFISKINDTSIVIAEDLDIVMPIVVTVVL